MASLCDDIARFICDALKETQQIDLQRNLLAERFRCAPSQITYVLSTRFTPQNGYHVESRRGGGGYVRIIRLDALPGSAAARRHSFGWRSAGCFRIYTAAAESDHHRRHLSGPSPFDAHLFGRERVGRR